MRSRPWCAASRIGRRLAAWLHEVGRVIDHRREVALAGAAKVLGRLIFEVVAVHARPDILGPPTTGSGLCGDLRICDADGCEAALWRVIIGIYL
jgi:hypothetical protein